MEDEIRIGCISPYVSERHAHSAGPKRNRESQRWLRAICAVTGPKGPGFADSGVVRTDHLDQDSESSLCAGTMTRTKAGVSPELAVPESVGRRRK
jgi:hypothetical protein